MKANPVTMVESLEGRRLMCANLGEGVSTVATSEPGAMGDLTQYSIEVLGNEFGQRAAETALHPETFPGCSH